MILVLSWFGCATGQETSACAQQEAPPITSPVASRIYALEDAGSHSWDEEVKRILVNEYDADNSGSVNTVSELEAVGCQTWWALNRSTQEKSTYKSAFYVVYGLPPDYIWIDTLGLDEGIREAAWKRIQEQCGMCDA